MHYTGIVSPKSLSNLKQTHLMCYLSYNKIYNKMGNKSKTIYIKWFFF